MSVIAFLVIGLIVGLVARAILPGTQSMGLIATTALGMMGSFVGGLISAVLSSRTDWAELQPSGIVFSVLGAVLLLFAVSGFGQRVRM